MTRFQALVAAVALLALAVADPATARTTRRSVGP